ncbi:MAG TPA: hypothetical protein VFH39_01985, partial [Candidatus Saccharimonadales bacterium]|nr:hypothetical protein [Candidatus Saccharimonadales bacterium]
MNGIAARPLTRSGAALRTVAVGAGIVVAGVGAALTYHLYENAVHQSITLVWYDWFDTNVHRWLVLPLTLVLTLMFFGLQHYLDPKSETHEEQGLGEMPAPSVWHYVRVLLIGYFSLLAGAVLGPEAILVPACTLLGAYVGSRAFADQRITRLLAAAGFMALFTAFFDSFLVGVLSMALVMKQARVRFEPVLLLTAVVASASSYVTLQLVEGHALARLPAYSWVLSFKDVLLCLVLVIAGYGMTAGIAGAHQVFGRIGRIARGTNWWWHALVAAAGIAALYLIGGNLVEFTGNASIVPMFKQAAHLGFAGLI